MHTLNREKSVIMNERMPLVFIAGEIYISLHKDATMADQLLSCYQAEIINYVFENLYKNKVRVDRPY